jgi:hypothetical protein
LKSWSWLGRAASPWLNVSGARSNEALNLSRRYAARRLTPVRYAARRSHLGVAVSIGSFIQASGRTWPSKRILFGVSELRRRGGGGDLGVRRTLPVRSGLMGSVLAGF